MISYVITKYIIYDVTCDKNKTLPTFIYDIIYDIRLFVFLCDFLVITGIVVWVAEPHLPAAIDNESDRSMDPDEASDYAYRFPDMVDDPDSPDRIND